MTQEAWYETPENPLVDAIEVVTGKRPPVKTVGAYSFNDLTEDEQGWIQDWCSINANPGWATGLSMIEAAELIVSQAVENANINPKANGK